MRIVLVNWAQIWDGASYGGGVNQYCQSLAIELVRRGHDVVSLFGGRTYLPTPKHCFIRRHDDWMDVKVFEVINSPVMAPSIVQFEDPMGEVSAPELEQQVGRLLAELKPDAVHWNNIEGFSVGCVAKARAVSGARQFFSLHNYHTICPQVYLMQRHRQACFDFDNGHNCASCIEFKTREHEKSKLIAGYLKAHGRDPKAVEDLRHAWLGALGTLRRTVTGYFEWKRARARLAVPVAPPGKPAPVGGGSGDIGLPVLQPQPAHANDSRGKTKFLLAELNPWRPPPPDSPELRPLYNLTPPEPPSDKVPNDYARRRAAMIAMLNSCDGVLAVSDFVRRKFVSLGVDDSRIRTRPIGSRINRVVALKPDLTFPPPVPKPEPTPWPEQRPLRLHFMGYNNYYKGLHVLAEALELMGPEHLRQIDLSIFALDGQSIEWIFRRLEPRLAKLKFGYEYNYHDIPWMLGGRDLTVVPSVWWDNAPQTVFESMACGVPVLGADVGGIPDFVADGYNGLLFVANSRASLAQTLRKAVEDPRMVWSLRQNVRPPKDISEHAIEMEQVYSGVDPGEVVVNTPAAAGTAAPSR